MTDISSMHIAITLFIITYILMLVFSKFKTIFANLTAGVFILIGFVPLQKALNKSDLNALLMIASTMVIVFFFIESKMPLRLAEILLRKVSSIKMGVVVLSIFSGFVSAFIDNVATVLMVAPIGLAMAKKMKISPIGPVICIAVSSNLQGAATLVGDTTSILLGQAANMNFLDFLYMDGKLGIFWAVQLGALATIPVILLLFRKEKSHTTIADVTVVKEIFPSILLVSMVVLLILASFIPGTPVMINSLICAVIALIGLGWSYIKNNKNSLEAIKDIDYNTLLLLIGVFVMVKGLENTGAIKIISLLMTNIVKGNTFLIYTLLVVFSVILSAFIDNIPYVVAMLPVVTNIATTMNISPNLLYFGLLIGATLGGNITPIGASANIAAIGILRKNGFKVTTKEFIRIGIPFTLVAVFAGYVFLWLVWS